jgi:hypothetical protein
LIRSLARVWQAAEGQRAAIEARLAQALGITPAEARELLQK